MIFIYLAPQHKIVISRDIVKSMDKYVLLGHAPAGVKPLEVRFAHPVRLSPDTHSQGHGRPCLQRPHPRRGFSATWSLLMVISMLCDTP